MHQDTVGFAVTVGKITIRLNQLRQNGLEEALSYLETILTYIMRVREDLNWADMMHQLEKTKGVRS